MKKITLYVSVVVIFFLSSGSMAHGKTLCVASFGSDIPAITSLAPSFNPDSYSVITQIFDSLIHLSLEGKRIPAPATSWKLIAEKTYEFKFREGVKFHNDEDFDANDIKFTCKKIIDPATKAGNAWIIGTIKEVQMIDPYTVRIKLRHPDGMFLFRLTMFGSIVPEDYTKKVGLEEFHKNPIGTGPFKFVNWQHGKEIVLEKAVAFTA